MIEREFERSEGSEAVGFSDRDFGLVVQTLDAAAGEQLLSSEVVEDQLAVLTEERSIFFMGSMRDGSQVPAEGSGSTLFNRGHDAPLRSR